MSPEEMSLRYRYRQHLYRHQIPTNISIGSLAVEKQQYTNKYGIEAHDQLIREVEIEVAKEMQNAVPEWLIGFAAVFCSWTGQL